MAWSDLTVTISDVRQANEQVTLDVDADNADSSLVTPERVDAARSAIEDALLSGESGSVVSVAQDYASDAAFFDAVEAEPDLADDARRAIALDVAFRIAMEKRLSGGPGWNELVTEIARQRISAVRRLGAAIRRTLVSRDTPDEDHHFIV